MLVFIGKCAKLILDARAVSRSESGYLSGEKRRVFETSFQDRMNLLVSVDKIAASLCDVGLHRRRNIQERETPGIFVSGLDFKPGDIDGFYVNPWRCSGFHPSGFYSEEGQLFRKAQRRWFADPSAFRRIPADKKAAVQKSPCGKNDFGSGKFSSHRGNNSANYMVITFCFPFESIDDKIGDCVLPYVKSWSVFQKVPPVKYEELAVTLGPGTPYSGAFGAVEHPELDGRSVCNQAHSSAQSIYLSDYLTLSYSTHGRIARHLGYFVHIHCYKQNLTAHTCGRECGFASSVAGTNYNHIVFSAYAHGILTFVSDFYLINIELRNQKFQSCVFSASHLFLAVWGNIVFPAKVEYSVNDHP